MSRHHIAVTGMGVVHTVGIGPEALWQALGRTQDKPIPRSLEAFDPSAWIAPSEARRMAVTTQLAVAAAEQALDDAGRPQVNPARVATIVGNAHGASSSLQALADAAAAAPDRPVPPFAAVMANSNVPAAQIAIRNATHGPTEVVSAACVSAVHAFGRGIRLLQHDEVDLAVVGAAFEPWSPFVAAAYESMRILSAGPFPRPFDARRDGFVPAPASAMFVLERVDDLRARAGRARALVLGFGITNDGYHPVQADGDGAVRCLELAMAEADIGPGDVRHVNAHGSATPANGRTENAVLHRVFGAHPPVVVSSKGALGHSLDAAGAVEAATTILAFEHQLLPPTLIDFEPDPEIDLDIVVGAARPWTPGISVSISYGLGGQNGALVLAP